MKHARDLCKQLGYVQWRRFNGVIGRAQHLIANGWGEGRIETSSRSVGIGSGASRSVVDYDLDKAAVKLVTQLAAAYKLVGHFPIRNESVILRLLKQYCDAKGISLAFQKRVIGHVFDAVVANRIVVEFDEPHHHESGRSVRRDAAKDRRCREEGLALVRVTLEHNIVDLILAIEAAIPTSAVASDDARYNGLYNGLGTNAIKRRKGIPATENLMDRMDTTELAANQFRMTQARDQLAKDRVKNQQQAIRTHERVGREVRAAIQRIGGTMPENIKPAEHIKTVEQRLKDATPKLELEDKDAKGLAGES